MATVQEARAATEDFLRFYLQGGAEAVRAGTQLIEAAPADLQGALARFDAKPGASQQPQSAIESDSLEAFVRAPGIARRMPALIGTAPDFVSLPSSDLPSPRAFPPPPSAALDPETADLHGPLTPIDVARPFSNEDLYADLCAMEDAVVVAVGDRVEVSFLWVQDYPLEVLESASAPDPTNLPEQALPRIRPLVDVAQPSIVAVECMEALQAFLGPELFQQFSFTWRLELCGFEALASTRAALAQP